MGGDSGRGGGDMLVLQFPLLEAKALASVKQECCSPTVPSL